MNDGTPTKPPRGVKHYKEPSGLLMSVIRTLSTSETDEQRDKEKGKLEKDYKKSNARLEELVSLHDKELTQVMQLFVKVSSYNLFNFGDVDGIGHDAKLQHPLGITYSDRENALYLCDTYNNRLKKVNLATMECFSTHQNDGLFKEPSGCVLNEEEDVLFVADTNNHRIVTYDIQTRALDIFEIREPEPDQPVGSAELEWELETEVSKMGGLLVLAINLEPESVTGTWRIDLTSSNIETRDFSGTVSSEELRLEMKFLPNMIGVLEMATIYFNLRFCYENACYAKRCVLTLYVMRSDQGPEFQEMEFNRYIIP